MIANYLSNNTSTTKTLLGFWIPNEMKRFLLICLLILSINSLVVEGKGGAARGVSAGGSGKYF